MRHREKIKSNMIIPVILLKLVELFLKKKKMMNIKKNLIMYIKLKILNKSVKHKTLIHILKKKLKVNILFIQN